MQNRAIQRNGDVEDVEQRSLCLFPLRTVRDGWDRSRHRSDAGATNGSEEPRGLREQFLVEKFTILKIQADTYK